MRDISLMVMKKIEDISYFEIFLFNISITYYLIEDAILNF